MSSGRKTRKSDSDIEQELVPTVHKRHSYAPTDPEASPYKRRDSYVPTEPEASPYKRHSYAPTESDDVEPELVPMQLTPLDSEVLNHPAIKKIKTYVTPGSRVKRWLKSTRKVARERQCPHTGECLVLGKRFTDLYRYFNKFVDFSMAVGDLRRIAKGATGQVAEVHYKRGEYSAYAVLKSMGDLKGGGDNLAYEYIVGVHFINRIFKFFPCFIYTYGLFKYNTSTDHARVLRATVAAADLSSMLTPLPYSITPSLINHACEDKAELCLLVQHLHKVKTLKHYLEVAYNKGDTRFLNDLAKVLFILYHALDTLKSVFTHYDFHIKNVLIYELPRVTEFRYEYPDGVVTFKMKYLPKIIDYGRCYFNYDQNKNFKQLSSEDVRAKICSAEKCKPCETQRGLQFLTIDTFGDGHTQVRKKNISNDLRLLYMIDEYRLIFDDTAIQQELRALVARVKYDYKYSTSEQLESGGDEIYNVTDAHIALKRLVEAYPDDSHASDILVVTGTTPVVQI